MSSNNSDSPIGVFDSGIGGLTVLKEIRRLLPGESTIYLGDTARVPYGIRSPETVIKYSFENTQFLVEKGIKMLVIACNTASSVGLDNIRQSFSIPVIGVIDPGARAAVKFSDSGRIGVIGTEATIKSKAYKKAITAINEKAVVIERACPLFVPLVEEGWLEDEITGIVASRYLRDLKNFKIDTLVLGCTHYPLLKGIIKEVVGEHVTLIDSAVETAKAAKETLGDSGIFSSNVGDALHKYFVTDSPGRFSATAGKFLDEAINNIELKELMSLEEMQTGGIVSEEPGLKSFFKEAK